MKNNGQSGMIPAQRRKLILAVIYDQGAVSVQQLSDRVGASLATIRRDLDLLAGENLIIRSHGGASPTNSAQLPSAQAPSAQSVGQNWSVQLTDDPSPVTRALGVAAADRIEEGQHVIFDSGLSCVEAARRIIERQISITAVTNSIKISSILAQADFINLIVLGGTRKVGTWTVTGEPGQGFLEGLNADIALMNTQAVARGRVWHNSIEIANMKRRMVKAARNPILIAESWKFGGPAFCEVCSFSELAEVITDNELAEADRQMIQKNGLVLTLVECPEEAARKTSLPETAKAEQK